METLFKRCLWSFEFQAVILIGANNLWLIGSKIETKLTICLDSWCLATSCSMGLQSETLGFHECWPEDQLQFSTNLKVVNWIQKRLSNEQNSSQLSIILANTILYLKLISIITLLYCCILFVHKINDCLVWGSVSWAHRGHSPRYMK